MEEIISAIATPNGTGGVAIVRLSGAGVLALAAQMFTPCARRGEERKKVQNFQPNVMYAGKILGKGFTDFGFCVYFAAPKSFTGEDVVEFHCHGGAQIARGILSQTLALGARLAERGEFTKRAFIAGKLSLSSAEGMIDMINAESLAELRAGGLLYGERLTDGVKKIQENLTDLLAGIAADVDYPEEGIESDELSDIGARLACAKKSAEELASGYATGKWIKSGVSVAICGAPNVGKSSLLNALLGYDKAIVSPLAGTTRDAVEGSIEIDGVRYHLTDTAGIRETDGEIESVGIERAKRILKSADVVLCVSESDDYSAASGVEEERLIRVFGMIDARAPYGSYDVALSALTGEGLDGLKKKLAEKAVGGKSLDGAFVIEERHYACLVRAIEKLNEAIGNLGSYPLDLISLDIREAWRVLGEITGETADEDIIDTVFAKFCVGK